MTSIKFNNRPVEKSVDRFINDLFQGFPFRVQDEFRPTIHKEPVPVNIRETSQEYKVELVAPGFEKNEFTINLDQNVLTVSGERKTDAEKKEDRFIRREYHNSGFKRSFTIDEKIDATGIRATYVNGVLELNLPKKTEVKEAAKSISVQ